eukprot:258758-Hanusia_phi.AAC.1
MLANDLQLVLSTSLRFPSHSPPVGVMVSVDDDSTSGTLESSKRGIAACLLYWNRSGGLAECFADLSITR